MKSKVVALSAISAGFIALVLSLGAYIEFVDLFALIVSSVFVLLPLYYNSFKGAILTYLAGGILAFLFSFNLLTVVFPAYFLFAGLYPIIKFLLLNKNANKTLLKIIGVIWCLLATFGIYYFYVYVMKIPFDGLPKFITNNIEIFVAIVGLIFFVVYDRFLIVMRDFTNRYLSRIIK